MDKLLYLTISDFFHEFFELLVCCFLDGAQSFFNGELLLLFGGAAAHGGALVFAGLLLNGFFLAGLLVAGFLVAGPLVAGLVIQAAVDLFYTAGALSGPEKRRGRGRGPFLWLGSGSLDRVS